MLKSITTEQFDITPELNSRRSPLEIIREILELKESSKTSIMYKVNLSYALLQKYLNFLLKQGLLACHHHDNGRITYYLTPKGELLLTHLRYLQEQLPIV